MIDLKLLIKNGVQFGHETSRWSPKMKPYIWGHKNNIHLINVFETARMLERAAKFLESIAAEGKSILLVGTKKAAQKCIAQTAQDLRLPFVVHRWVGGTFSNHRQVKKSVANLMHFEDILAKSEQFHYSKKELNVFSKRAERLTKNVGGIRALNWPVGAVVVVDVKKEHVCIKEAITMGIPIVALVDTNSDPSNIDFVIPSNDDAPRAIELIVAYLAEAIKRGQEVAKAKPVQNAAVSLEFEAVFDPIAALTEEGEEEASKRRAAAGVKAKKPAPMVRKAPVRVAPQEVAHQVEPVQAEKAVEVVAPAEDIEKN